MDEVHGLYFERHSAYIHQKNYAVQGIMSDIEILEFLLKKIAQIIPQGENQSFKKDDKNVARLFCLNLNLTAFLTKNTRKIKLFFLVRYHFFIDARHGFCGLLFIDGICYFISVRLTIYIGITLLNHYINQIMNTQSKVIFKNVDKWFIQYTVPVYMIKGQSQSQNVVSQANPPRLANPSSPHCQSTYCFQR